MRRFLRKRKSILRKFRGSYMCPTNPKFAEIWGQ